METFIRQVAIPLGKHDSYPISVSFVAAHGADMFLLDTVSDMYSSIIEHIKIASNSVPVQDINGDMDVPELLKEKVPLLIFLILTDHIDTCSNTMSCIKEHHSTSQFY